MSEGFPLLFTTKGLDAAYVRDVLAAWDANESWRRSARMVRLYDATRKKDGKKLRELALRFEGHRYLAVPMKVTWQDAGDIAESYGGHLATISSDREFAFIQDDAVRDGAILDLRHTYWVGLRRMPGGRTQWVTGEDAPTRPYIASHWRNRIDPGLFFIYGGMRGLVGNWPKGAPRGIMIEWDDP